MILLIIFLAIIALRIATIPMRRRRYMAMGERIIARRAMMRRRWRRF